MKTKITAVVALLAFVTVELDASTVTVSCGPAMPGVKTIVRYTVVAAAGETIKDFHLRSVENKGVAGVPRSIPNPNIPPAPDLGWTGSKGNGMVNWKTNGPGITAGNSVTFEIELGINDPCPTADALWWTTSNGDKDFKPADVIDNGPQIGDAPIFLATVQPPVLIVNLTEADFAHIGQATPVLVIAPTKVNHTYILAMALGDEPGIDVTPTIHIPLNPDPIFWLSLQPNPFVQGSQGILQQNGVGQALLFFPGDPSLIGITTYLAAVTIDANGISGVSESLPLVISP